MVNLKNITFKKLEIPDIFFGYKKGVTVQLYMKDFCVGLFVLYFRKIRQCLLTCLKECAGENETYCLCQYNRGAHQEISEGKGPPVMKGNVLFRSVHFSKNVSNSISI